MQKRDPERVKKYLAAVSGGMDSIVLAHLLYVNGFHFAMVHCNFGLRGAHSDADRKFVEELSASWNVPLYAKNCPVSEGENVQVKARELRYAFFEKIRRKYAYDYILTAHHADDQLETFMINLMRGTGLDGLAGIEDSAFILRPLKEIFRSELENYAHNHGLKWREDQSNATDKYLRNRIRHRLLPLMEEMRPGFKSNALRTMHLLKAEKAVSRDWYERIYERVKKENHFRWIDRRDLPNGEKKRVFLWRWLKGYGFSDADLMARFPDLEPGKRMESSTHVLYATKDRIYLYPKDQGNCEELIFESLEELAGFDEWEVRQLDKIPEHYRTARSDEAYLDAAKFKPPYVLRPWQPGDRFVPLGMKGSKKISDFLTDIQYPPPLRKGVKVLIVQGRIAWIPGLRLSDEMKITEETGRVVYIRLRKK